MGQAVGLVLAKQGMLEGEIQMSALEASFLRLAAALVGIWLITAMKGELKSTIAAFRNIPAMGFCAAGSVVGPFLGVWMSMVAVKLIPAGIAATLTSLIPVAIIPVVVFINKEKVSKRAILGALVSVSGVAILMLS